ncbi:MAG: hypothetical protein IT286_05720 [Proteobacteria bacterium]|jgi:dipeptide/tripeptide permease|nr:hypothetical protein [Pseudomonadota bacterium]
MRTLIIIASGLVLFFVAVGLSKFFQIAPSKTVKGFVLLWLIAAATNMWIGISKAGYSFMDELPIFLVIFLVPAVTAIVVWKKMLQ